MSCCIDESTDQPLFLLYDGQEEGVEPNNQTNTLIELNNRIKKVFEEFGFEVEHPGIEAEYIRVEHETEPYGEHGTIVRERHKKTFTVKLSANLVNYSQWQLKVSDECLP